ncbi:hypothetical protein BSKO_06546 [Bryopsis sp. KO-2023]|nr:hypothetical protein BSKO_06546 [Bryopsis sp. KO-2023]
MSAITRLGFFHAADSSRSSGVHLEGCELVKLCAGGWGCFGFIDEKGNLEYHGNDAWGGRSLEKVECCALGWDFAVVKSRGRVIQWGWNEESKEYVDMPLDVGLPPWVNITQVAAGECHVLALGGGDGCVWAWGSNKNGQLGTGDKISMKSPDCIAGVNAISQSAVIQKRYVQIACGARHSCAVSIEGDLLCWGWCLYGQCGHNSTDDVLEPKLVSAMGGLNIKHVSAGLGHTVACTESGDLYSWGMNTDGQLGHGDESSRIMPELIDTEIISASTMIKVSCGARHTVALSSEGDLFGWGWNKYGQLGHKEQERIPSPHLINFVRDKGVLDVACGWWHSVFLTKL